MDVSQLNIYNFPPQPPRWDRIGIFFVSFAASWTTFILAGMAFCWYNRELPILKVRGLPLAFGSVIFLHLYWLMAQIVYPVGGSMPIPIAYTVQYYIMGTWFPLGIALFHAANLRFLRVAKLQKRFATPDLKRKEIPSGPQPWLSRIRNMGYTKKVMTFILTGVIVQWVLCAAMWIMCRKYHPSFGIRGTEIKGSTIPEQLIDLGRGWEWWPSVVWQFIWTWGVAPFLIVRAWSIRDTMGWRTQTIGACVSGLHATPMFLVASYVPAFYGINQYFPPSQWIHLHTFFLEIITVFVPAYEVIKDYQLRKQTAHRRRSSDAESGQTVHVDLPFDKNHSRQGSIEEALPFSEVTDSNIEQILGIETLNRVLSECPGPLLEFSAYSDFSAENIAFLLHVSRWKDSVLNKNDKSEKRGSDSERRVDDFHSALEIYLEFVSPRDADFPLNLSWQQLKDLEDIFERPARILQGEGKQDDPSSVTFNEASSQGSDHSRFSGTTLLARYTGEISQNFAPTIFDDAEKHVQHLVLLNTWPKFVREVQSKRRKSTDSEGSAMSAHSESTVFARVTHFVRGL